MAVNQCRPTRIVEWIDLEGPRCLTFDIACNRQCPESGRSCSRRACRVPYSFVNGSHSFHLISCDSHLRTWSTLLLSPSLRVTTPQSIVKKASTSFRFQQPRRVPAESALAGTCLATVLPAPDRK